MNFLIKLAAEMLEGNPSKEKIECAKKILDSMINQPPESSDLTDLDPGAEQARRELT